MQFVCFVTIPVMLMACFFKVRANTDSPELLKALYRLSPGLCVSRLCGGKPLTKLPPTVPPPRTPLSFKRIPPPTRPKAAFQACRSVTYSQS